MWRHAMATSPPVMCKWRCCRCPVMLCHVMSCHVMAASSPITWMQVLQTLQARLGTPRIACRKLQTVLDWSRLSSSKQQALIANCLITLFWLQHCDTLYDVRYRQMQTWQEWCNLIVCGHFECWEVSAANQQYNFFGSICVWMVDTISAVSQSTVFVRHDVTVTVLVKHSRKRMQLQYSTRSL